MRAVLLAFLLLASMLSAGSAEAAMVGDARVPFRALRTVVVNGHSYTGLLFHIPGHERHEQDLLGLHEIFLLDIGARQGDLVIPALRTYVDFPFPPLMADLAAPDLLRQPVGEETVAGLSATKYRVDHRARNGSRAVGYLWLSRNGVLVKFDIAVTRRGGGKPLRIAMTLSHVVLGPQDPRLFTLPAGLTRLPAAALAPLLGGESH